MAHDRSSSGVKGFEILQRWAWPIDPAIYGAAYSDQDPEGAVNAITRQVDKENSPFRWRILFVAGLGFLTDSYNLFATNVILPALSYLYWGQGSRRLAASFNIATLVGSMCGQVLFGVLVDIYGRRALYGIELMIVIVSTLGLLQCSQGYFNADGQTWDISVWLFFWRVIMGIGIGAEYPLSACIAAEWSSKQHRARMMSAVFLMQPLGQIFAYIVGIGAILHLGFRPDLSDGERQIKVDIFWRIVIGFGAIPTLLALLARRLIPESWRFTYFVARDPDKATLDSRDVYGHAFQGNDFEMRDAQHDSVLDEHIETEPARRQSVTAEPGTTRWSPGSQFQLPEIRRFLSDYGARLIATSLTWLLLDVAFYGMGFNSASTLSKLWTKRRTDYPPGAPWWLKNSDLASLTSNVDEVMLSTMKHAIYTTSIAAVIGSVAFVALAHRLNRRKMLIITFFLLAVLLGVTAGAFKWLFHDGEAVGKFYDGGNIGLIVLWITIQGLFNFGPNTLTFILPAELFPTKYRCTSYGIAAASGKLGALLITIINWKTSHGDPNSSKALIVQLAVFSGCMALGGVIALWPKGIPNVQVPRNGESLGLEELNEYRHRPQALQQGRSESVDIQSVDAR